MLFCALGILACLAGLAYIALLLQLAVVALPVVGLNALLR
jgi:hypothetical protein